ncbi:MAG: Stp1/IreP family PP2C-type Ser/Thr phosphatase [Deltaproteobacteria bacterium]|nr:Stp1/IreP family PP2C-type Ser/Thr phosphatase [Deltaproteobacteria bacterium]
MTDSPAQAQAGTIRLRLFGRTDVGRVREHNEDNFLIADLTRKSRSLLEQDRQQVVGERGTLMAVCDGMGGAAAGEVASELAVNIIYEKLAEGDVPRDRDDLARRLVRAVEAAGLRIYSEAKLDRQHRGMGTTATVAALIDSHLFLAQVGDSRGYILRGDRLVQVTRDQSLVNQLIEAGQLTEEEAENFEHNNIILQALGTADSVQVDLTYVELRRGDTLMMCSDGLSGMVRFDDLRETLRANDDPFEACRVLVEKANQAGGHDNITCIVAKFDGETLQPVSDEDAVLRYSKYSLPDDVANELTPAARRSGIKELDGPKIGETKDRLTDHGPSKSKVATTMVGGQSPLAGMDLGGKDKPLKGAWHEGPGAADDEVIIPVSGAPLWVLLAIVLGVFGAIIGLAFFLMRT